MTGIQLILGGARSGKSRYAEQQACDSRASVAYIATAQALDSEMDQRIEHHRDRRPAHWLTIEQPLQLAAAIEQAPADALILVDCLTLWVTNCLLHEDPQCWPAERQALLDTLAKMQADGSRTVLLVSNEVGYGIVPMGDLSRRFVDESGWLHQSIAQMADGVTLVVAGIPMRVK